MHEILLALVIVHAEAFGADRTTVNRLLIDCRLTYLISLIRTVDKHVRFNVINRGYDFFQRYSSGRLTRH